MNKIKTACLFILISISGLVAYYFYPDDALPDNTRIDRLVVHKSKRQMLAYSNGILVRTYKISLGRQPVGHKQFEGDRKTPEGVYFINDKNPNSAYHKNLGVSYPNEIDAENAKRSGKSPGGDIKIHGLRNNMGFVGKFHRWFNWTMGCIAVTNKEMDELYGAVGVGTPIEILP